MDQLKSLADTTIALRDVSKSILGKMIPIMEDVVNVDGDIVSEVLHVAELEDADAVSEFLKNVTLQMIDDAAVIHKEVEIFGQYVAGGRSVLDANIAQFPFLAQVWYGDAYDGIDELQAIKKLLAELTTSESQATDDWMIQHATSHFTKKA